MYKNDLIIGLSNEFLIELGKTKPSNLQNAVNRHYDLWNKDGGLIQMLTERDLGVYKVLASILVSGGYEHANEMNVGRCVRRLLDTRNNDISSYVDTQTKGNPSLVPGSAVTLTHAVVSKPPVSHGMTESGDKVVSSPRSSTENHTSTGVSGWWDEVAQALNVKLEKVSSSFDWDFVGRNLEHESNSKYVNDFTEQEIELLGNVLMLVKKRNLDALDMNMVKNDFYIRKEKEIVGWLLAKVENLGYIKI